MKKLRIFLWVLVPVAALALFLQVWSGGYLPTARSGPGGDFVLTAHTGSAFESEAYRGRFLLIYFGYSFCPDVCPLELAKLSTALYRLEDEGYDTSLFQPVFISVDPERDTVEALQDYVALYHPRLVGLTGSAEDIAAVAEDYGVYYEKKYDESLGTYLMDHFSAIFAIGPEGRFQGFFTKEDGPDDIAAILRPVLDEVSAGSGR